MQPYGPMIPGVPLTKMAKIAIDAWKKKMKKRRGEGAPLPSAGGGSLDKSRIPKP